MHPRTVLISVALAVILPGSAIGQTRLPVLAGARVRLWPNAAAVGRLFTPAGRSKVVATLVRATLDSVVVEPAAGGAGVALAVADLGRLEVSGGRHARTGRGAVIGLLAGGLGGAVTGAILCGDCGPNTYFDRGQVAAIFAVLGGAAGLGLGALIGSFVRHERWENVPLRYPRLTLAPVPHGFKAGLSFRLPRLTR